MMNGCPVPVRVLNHFADDAPILACGHAAVGGIYCACWDYSPPPTKSIEKDIRDPQPNETTERDYERRRQ